MSCIRAVLSRSCITSSEGDRVEFPQWRVKERREIVLLAIACDSIDDLIEVQIATELRRRVWLRGAVVRRSMENAVEGQATSCSASLAEWAVLCLLSTYGVVTRMARTDAP